MYLFKVILPIFLFIFKCTDDLTEPDVETDIGNKKVLIFGIDGFRSDMLTEDVAPNLFSMISEGNTAFTLKNRTEPLTISGPNWGSICTGVHVDKHNVRENLFRGNKLQQYPHFYKYIEGYDSRIRTASYTHWFPINLFIALGKADYAPVNVDISDQKVTDHAVKMLTSGKPISPDLLFLHLDDCDGAGHGYGFHRNIPEYVSAINQTDQYFGEVVDAIKSRPSYKDEDWLICVVSDHGGEGQSHDDYNEPNIRNTIMILNNKSAIESNTELSDVEQVDLVPTIMDFLDIPVRESWELDGNSLLN